MVHNPNIKFMVLTIYLVIILMVLILFQYCVTLKPVLSFESLVRSG